uniref:Uncharacterized protein n=1 Tax=Oryza brachyantha TaxID=4533 RepID=J3MWC0_ORYBR
MLALRSLILLVANQDQYIYRTLNYVLCALGCGYCRAKLILRTSYIYTYKVFLI